MHCVNVFLPIRLTVSENNHFFFTAPLLLDNLGIRRQCLHSLTFVRELDTSTFEG